MTAVLLAQQRQLLNSNCIYYSDWLDGRINNRLSVAIRGACFAMSLIRRITV